jgi:hypothetical protein
MAVNIGPRTPFLDHHEDEDLNPNDNTETGTDSDSDSDISSSTTSTPGVQSGAELVHHGEY